ncbi:MAG: hypothetical protein ACI9XO_004994 [Paraglaciecola sp.]|jgi:hypothetical protein
MAQLIKSFSLIKFNKNLHMFLINKGVLGERKIGFL